jgi:nucleoside-diphosphate-sugar epimerase
MAENNAVVVTGAMGQLGKRVSKLLLERGRTVVALDVRNDATVAVAEELRASAGPGTLIPAFVNLLAADEVRKLVAQHEPATIIHLAAIVSPTCYKNPQFARRVNVEGTRNLVEAAKALPNPPFFLEASSSAVYGSRNPHRHTGRITPDTPVNPVECYGEDKVAAEQLIAQSGLPHASLRLGGIISPDGVGKLGPEYFVLLRATPRDNRVHAVDARDAALAFANATDVGPSLHGKTLLIGGDDSCLLLQGQIQDDMMEAIGIGRLGPATGLPGDPGDERGWGLSDWFETSEAQRLLGFQQHSWSQTLAWIRASQGSRVAAMRVVGPLVRPLLRGFFVAQQRWERRGQYADPWALISQKYGSAIVAPTRF